MIPRWIKFYVVGGLGMVVQLAFLWLLTKTGLGYLAATALGVEAAVLHNFWWHLRWTWSDRSEGGWSGSLLRFHLANGLVSIVANLILMRIFAGSLGMPLLPANVLAIAITSVLNFVAGDRWVFAQVSMSRANGRFERGTQ